MTFVSHFKVFCVVVFALLNFAMAQLEKPRCQIGQKFCPTAESGCIPASETCACAKGRKYCEEIQRCLSVKNFPLCPNCTDTEFFCRSRNECMFRQDDVDCKTCGENEFYCPTLKQCLNRSYERQCVKCSLQEKFCPTSEKPCIALSERCACGEQKVYCKEIRRCVHADARCPNCEEGQFFCRNLRQCMADLEREKCPICSAEAEFYCPKLGSCLSVERKEDCYRCTADEACEVHILPVGESGTTKPDDTSSNPDGTTSDPDDTTTKPDATTSDPDGTTTKPDGTTSDPDGTTSKPDDTTSDPDGTTSDPDATTSDPDATTSDPDGTTSDPDDTTSDPDGTTTKPDDTTSEPDDTTSDPDDTTSNPDDTTSEPDDTTTKPDDTTSNPDGTASNPDGTTSDPDETTTNPDGTTSKPDGTTSNPDATTTKPDDTTSYPDDTTTSNPDGTTTKPDDTTSYPDDTTTSNPDGTTTKPDDTTSEPDDTTSNPDGTTSNPDGTTSNPDGTTSNPDGTTSEPDDTTSNPDDTTSNPDDTTSNPDGGDVTPPSLERRYVFLGNFAYLRLRRFFKSLVDIVGGRFQNAMVDSESLRGVWQKIQVSSDGEIFERIALKKGAKLTAEDKIAFAPSNRDVHGLIQIILVTDKVQIHVGIIILPCVPTKLEVKTDILTTNEDTELPMALNEIISVSRGGVELKRPHLLDHFIKYIPRMDLIKYEEKLGEMGKNLGVFIRSIHPFKSGFFKESASRQNRFIPTIYPLERRLVFKPLKNFNGEIQVEMYPVDLPTTSNMRSIELHNFCPVGRPAKITIKVTSVNKKPHVTNTRNLNIWAEPLPYSLNGQASISFPVSDLTRRVVKDGKDSDGDSVGIGVVSSKPTSIGEWQYASQDASGVEIWNTLNMEVELDDNGKFTSDSVNILFMKPEQKLRFKPKLETTLWSTNEAFLLTQLRFLLWDRTDQLSPGLHSIKIKAVRSMSARVITARINRLGCDGKAGSKSTTDNQCGVCEPNKCQQRGQCDAVINDCGHCVLGSTGKEENFGKDCMGTCTGSYIEVCDTCVRKNKKVKDCFGSCGTARINKCGVCSLDERQGFDVCGVCNGTGTTCLGCDDVPNSGKKLDACGNCLLPTDTNFNKGCFGLREGQNKIIVRNEEHEMQISGAGLLKVSECRLVSKQQENIQITVKKIESDALMNIAVPAIKIAGDYKLSCTIDNNEYNEGVIVTVVEPLTVSRVEPVDITIGDEIDEVTVSGSGFTENNEMMCTYCPCEEVEARDAAGKRLCPRTHAKYISDVQIKCSLPKPKAATCKKVAVILSKTTDASESVELKFFDKAPAFVDFKFNYKTNEIALKFDSAIQNPESCQDIFDCQLTMETLTGLNAECKRKQADVLAIKLPPRTRISQNLELCGSIKSSGLFSHSKSFSVAIPVPSKKRVPIAVITGTTTISLCNKIRLSGRKSKHTGRDYQCLWSVGVENEAGASQEIKDDLIAIRGILNNDCYFHLTKDYVKPGAPYIFKLKVRNADGESEEVSHTVERSDREVPTITRLTKLKEFDMSKKFLKLGVRAKCSDCLDLCNIGYLWTCTSHPNLKLKNNQSRTLEIPSNDLRCNEVYTFKALAFMSTKTDLSNSVSFEITTKEGKLFTKFKGGDRFIAGNRRETIKTITKSRGTCTGSAVSYHYSCTDEDGYTCLLSDKTTLKFPDEPNIKFDAKKVKGDTKYNLTVHATKGEQSSSDSIIIKVGSGMSVKIRQKKMPNGVLVVNGVVTSKQSADYKWENVVEKGYGVIDLENNDKISGSFAGNFVKPAKLSEEYSYTRILPALKFHVGALEGNIDYKLRLSARVSDIVNGSVTTLIKTDSPPTEGQLDINPTQGEALKTMFTICAIDYLDDDNDEPLSYTFYFRKQNKKSKKFINIKSEENCVESTLPADDALTIGVIVRGSTKAFVETKTTVVVTRAANVNVAELMSDFKKDEGMDKVAKASKLSMVREQLEQSDDVTPEEIEELKEMEENVLLDSLKEGDRNALSLLKDIQPDDVEAFSENTKKVINSSVPEGVKKAGVQLKKDRLHDDSETETLKRRRRALEEESEDVVEEDRTPMTIQECEDALATYENLVDPRVVDNVTQDYLESVDNILINICESVPLGESAYARSNKLGVLKSHMTYMNDKKFHNVSMPHGLVNHTALVRFGDELQSLYNEWNCSGDEMCNGACATTAQYPHDFFTADKSGKRRSDVVYIGLKNPVNFDHIPVSGLKDEVRVQIPLHDGCPVSKSYRCVSWNNPNKAWTPSFCNQREKFTRDSRLFVECSCTDLGYVTVEEVGDEEDEVEPTTQTTTIESSTTTTKDNQAVKRQNAECSMKFSVDYNSVVKDTNTKQELEKRIEETVCEITGVGASNILNVQVKPGSIVATFIILAPDTNPTQSLNHSITQLLSAVNNGEFSIMLPNGTQLTADPGYLQYNYALTSGLMTDAVPTTSQPKNDDAEDDDDVQTLAIVMGVVIAVLIILIIIGVVVYKKHRDKKMKVSHHDVRTSASTCVANKSYNHNPEGLYDHNVRQSAELPQ